jgi:hypothetical protein
MRSAGESAGPSGTWVRWDFNRRRGYPTYFRLRRRSSWTGPRAPVAETARVHLKKQSVPKKSVYRPLYTEKEFRQGSGQHPSRNLNYVRPKCPMPPKTTSC